MTATVASLADDDAVLATIRDEAGTYAAICEALGIDPHGKGMRRGDRALQRLRKAGHIELRDKQRWWSVK